MSESTYNQIKARLDEMGIDYKTHHHEPTRTSEDAARIRGVALHSGAKAIVVQGSKSKEHALFVIPAHLRLDGKKAKSILGERISFAKNVEELTTCVPGSVPPFGSVIGLKTHVDKRLAANEIINFNAGLLTDSIAMTYKDYLRAEQPEVVDVAESES